MARPRTLAQAAHDLLLRLDIAGATDDAYARAKRIVASLAWHVREGRVALNVDLQEWALDVLGAIRTRDEDVLREKLEQAASALRAGSGG